MGSANQATSGSGWKTAVLRTTIRRILGGSGGNGAANTFAEITKAVSAITDATAKDVFTVTVPNAKHAAVFEVDVAGVLGAGGAVGAGETVKSSKYQVVVVRTAGLATVVTVSSAVTTNQAKVAGADNITSTVVDASAIAGGNTATQTFTIRVTITKAAGSSAAHTAFAKLSLLNGNASGITVV